MGALGGRPHPWVILGCLRGSTGVAKVPVMPRNPYPARLKTDSRTYGWRARNGATGGRVWGMAVPPQPLPHPRPCQHCYAPSQPRCKPRRAPVSVIGSPSASSPVSALYGSPSGVVGHVFRWRRFPFPTACEGGGFMPANPCGVRVSSGRKRIVSVMPIRGCGLVVSATRLAYGESPRQATTHRRVT